MYVFDHPRLFRGALEAVSFQAVYFHKEGWHAHLQTRRSGESWYEQPASDYTGLTSPELLDVLLAELGQELDLT